MCDNIKRSTNNTHVTGVTLADTYGNWSFEQRIISQLGPAGDELAARSHAAHDALLAALGADGFQVLDAYVSAATEMACAREEAIAAICLQGPCDAENSNAPGSAGPGA